MTKEAVNSRTVRVFLSSTFRDFMEERDLLVRKVFPELRRRCRQRQVELIEVDLRWGITEQEAQQGKVLPICLAEIDRARPFFMGLLGERYGWVPEKNQYDLSLIVEQPWLVEHRGGKSVTELEILHGVFNNPAMKNRAFFYLRDPRWAEKKGGAYLGEGPKEKAKLIELKTQIRQSGFPVVENYPNPETLAERVQQDLWKLIDEAYPESEVPDALALERRRHETYAATRMGLYLGGEKYFNVLDRAMRAEPFIPVLVTGQSGGGKSALLANWVERYRQAHPETGVIVHHLGSGADAADPVKMVVRLMQEIARITGDELKLENDPEKQLDQLPIQLAMAGAWAERTKREMLLILDGLDKVSDRKNLIWFPSILPAGVKVAASCLDGEILKAIQGRLGWEELKVKPFSNEEQAAFIRQYLGRYRKSLTPEQFKALQSFPLSGNPLFLLTVLEELRVFGVHEKLEERLRILLSPPPSKNPGEEPTVDDVFEHVLARLEKDLGQQAVQKALEAIWASRSGLYQEELLALAGLAPIQWAEIHNALDESLYESGGRINFGHDYLRKAVEDRYELTGKRKLTLHQRVARWFAQQPVDSRVAEELPWQWRQAESKEELTQCLVRKEIFEHAYRKDEYELLSYWLWTGGDIEQNHRMLWDSCQHGFEEKLLAKLAMKIAGFLSSAGFYGTLTEFLYDRVISYREITLGKNHSETLSAINNFGTFFRLKASFRKSEELYRKALAGYETLKGPDHPDVLMLLNNMGLLLSNQGAYQKADTFYRRAFEGYTKVYGMENLDTLSVLNNLANLHNAMGDFQKAEFYHSQCLCIREKVLGKEHPETIGSVNNLALQLSSQGRYSEAEPLYLRAAQIFERSLGPEHPDTLSVINNLGNHFSDIAAFDQAEIFYRRALAAKERIWGEAHPDTLLTVDNLGILMRSKGDLASAEVFFQRAFKGCEELLGPNHPDTLMSLNNLGVILSDQGDFAGAERIYSQVLEKKEKVLGEHHPDTLGTASNLALVLQYQGDLAGAEAMHRRALTGREKVFGAEHPSTLMSQANLATLLRKLGRLDEAKTLSEQVLSCRERALGRDHPDTVNSAFNLAIVLKDCGLLDQSEGLYLRCLGAREKLFGPEHAETLDILLNLGAVLKAKRKYSEAESAFKRAWLGFKKVKGDSNEKALLALSNLGIVIRDSGSLVVAEEAFQEVLTARQNSLGKSHTLTLSALGNLCDVKAKRGDFFKASSLLAGFSEFFRGDSDYLLYNLACYQSGAGQEDLAQDSIRKYLSLHPEKKAKAISDSDLVRIRAFIEELKL